MAFAVNDRWPRFYGRHGRFLLLCPLAHSPQTCAAASRCRGVPARSAAQAPLVRMVCWRIPGDLFIADSIKLAIDQGGVKSRKNACLLSLNAGTPCANAAAEPNRQPRLR